jgi:hypothetical protein
MNAKQIAQIAKDLCLVRGSGTYNGAVYWKRKGSNSIITAARVLEIAGYI